MFNVSRTPNPPASLARKMSYREADVVEALEKLFHKKCYLCETKEPLDINVEHFEAHEGDMNKKFNWENLYYVCSRCNNLKNRFFNNLLDCCDPKVDVSRTIKLLPPLTAFGKIVVQKQTESEEARQTEELLDKIYNSNHTINKKITGKYLRKKIFNQYLLLMKSLNIYYAEDSIPREKQEALEKIEFLMAPESQYSAFIKWCVWEDEDLKNELLQLAS